MSPVYPCPAPLLPLLTPAKEQKHFPLSWKQNAFWLTRAGIALAGGATDVRKVPMLPASMEFTVQNGNTFKTNKCVWKNVPEDYISDLSDCGSFLKNWA